MAIAVFQIMQWHFDISVAYLYAPAIAAYTHLQKIITYIKAYNSQFTYLPYYCIIAS